MKCSDVQTRLVESLYGELHREEETLLREHLAGCPACRQEMETLEQSRRQLAVLAQPDFSPNFGLLYRTAAQRSGRSRRRWRRLAYAASGAAGLTVLLLATRLWLDWQPGRLIVSFEGRPPATKPFDTQLAEASAARLSRHEERLEALEEIARLLSTELSRSDYRQAAALAELRRQLARSQREIAEVTKQMNLRCNLAEENIRDLHYLTQLSPNSNRKGALP
jgi:anti-sigma factor RsiW